MNSKATTKRAYSSPVREEKAKATREAILQALFDLMQSADAPEDIGMDAIGRAAGVERRTIFRHFETREKLFAAFWPWLNAGIGVSASPETVDDITEGPRRTFPRFEENDAVMRAMLHTRAGRDMRTETVPNRRALFTKALAPVCANLPPDEARKITALAHLLYSASAWEVLKDYGGLTGTEAGEAASWALDRVLSAVTDGDTELHTKEISDE